MRFIALTLLFLVAPAKPLVLGASRAGVPIVAQRYGDGAKVVYVIGVVHGDEPGGEGVVTGLAHDIDAHGLPDCLSRAASFVLVPCANPDGRAQGTRVNGLGVDLNRSFPTANQHEASAPGRYFGGVAASEPETQALLGIMQSLAPALLFVVHEPLALINYDGPGEAVATALARATGLPLRPEIGYATPGSIGTYWGKERGKPVITIELPDKAHRVATDTAMMAHAVLQAAEAWCKSSSQAPRAASGRDDEPTAHPPDPARGPH